MFEKYWRNIRIFRTVSDEGYIYRVNYPKFPLTGEIVTELYHTEPELAMALKYIEHRKREYFGFPSKLEKAIEEAIGYDMEG